MYFSISNILIKLTTFHHKIIHKETWKSNDEKTISEIDYVLYFRTMYYYLYRRTVHQALHKTLTHLRTPVNYIDVGVLIKLRNG